MAMQDTLNKAMTYIETLEIIIQKINDYSKILTVMCDRDNVRNDAWVNSIANKKASGCRFEKENLCFLYNFENRDKNTYTIFYLRNGKVAHFPKSVQEAGKQDGRNEEPLATADEIYKAGAHLEEFLNDTLNSIVTISLTTMYEGINSIKESAVADLL